MNTHFCFVRIEHAPGLDKICIFCFNWWAARSALKTFKYTGWDTQSCYDLFVCRKAILHGVTWVIDWSRDLFVPDCSWLMFLSMSYSLTLWIFIRCIVGPVCTARRPGVDSNTFINLVKHRELLWQRGTHIGTLSSNPYTYRMLSGPRVSEWLTSFARSTVTRELCVQESGSW
jgi:hypothetical protein